MTKNLLKVINEKGYTYNLISKKTGIPQSTISGWFNRGNSPRLEDIVRIADFLQCSVDYLIGRENEEGNIVFSDSVLQLSDLESELIKVFRSLPDKYKLQALGLMQGFAHSIRL